MKDDVRKAGGLGEGGENSVDASRTQLSVAKGHCEAEIGAEGMETTEL